MKRLNLLAILLMAPCLLGALDSAWQYQTDGLISGYPVQVDCDLDGTPEFLAPISSEAKIDCCTSDGKSFSCIERRCMIAGIAAADQKGPWAIEETSGQITIFTCPGNKEASSVNVGGKPLSGGGLVFADINHDEKKELLCARRNGVITAFDANLAPLWQYNSGLPIQASPAIAPVFTISCAIFVRAGGTLQAISGGGRPLWQFRTEDCQEQRDDSPPLVVQLAEEHPSVLLVQNGYLYAVDTLKGKEHWRAPICKGKVIAPAVVDYSEEEGRRIVVVDNTGSVVVLSSEGTPEASFHLPPGEYDPRPLVSDVDADGEWEILAASNRAEGNPRNAIVTASLSGTVEREIPTQGTPHMMALYKEQSGDYLKLVGAAGDKVFCIDDAGLDGWVHPRGDHQAGYINPLLQEALPLQEKSSRKARVDSIFISQFNEKDPFALAVVQPRLLKKAEYVSILVRNGGTVVGSAFMPAREDGVTACFVRKYGGPVSVDIGILDGRGGTIASETNIPVRARTVKLIDLPSLDPFSQAISQAAERYLARPLQNRGDGSVQRMIEDIFGYGSSMALAAGRGAATSAGAEWDAEFGPEARHYSPSLKTRLRIASLFAGAKGVIGIQDYAQPVDKKDLGIPYAPAAFLTNESDERVTGQPLLRYAFGMTSPTGLEQDVLTAGPNGDCFDIVRASSPGAMDRYAIIWAAPDCRLEGERRKALTAFVKGGGILVLPSEVAMQFPSRFAGVEFSGRYRVAEQVQTAVASAPIFTVPLRYAEMEAASRSQVLAWTEAGEPLLTWRSVGDGIIIVLASPDGLDESGQLLNLVPALLQLLTENLLPIQMPPQIETFFNRTDKQWIVGLINNRGVTKTPLAPAVTDPREARDLVLKFQKSVPLHFKSLLGDFAWDNVSNGLITHIGPGESAVVSLTLP